VDQVSALDSVARAKAELVPLLTAWFQAKLAVLSATSDADKAAGQPALDAAAQAVEAKLQSLPEGAGPRDIATLGGFMMQIASQGASIEQDASSMDRSQLLSLVRSLTEQLTNIVKSAPTVQLALEAIPAEALGLTILPQILPSGTNESTRGIVFRNVQTLNQIFNALHPEYRR
jgi:hypothetical protein